MKKPTLVTICILVVIGAVCFSNSKLKDAVFGINNSVSSNNVYSPKNIDLSKINWLQRYPQLKSIPANSQTAMIDKLRTSESISALIGPIDNPYGVRNDILDAILTIVPKDNPQMLRAAIKEAYYDNLSIYSKSDKDKLFYVRKSSLSMNCLFKYDVSVNNKFANKVAHSIGDDMRNTDVRDELIHHLETTVFAWQMVGTGLGSTTEEDLCQSGDY